MHKVSQHMQSTIAQQQQRREKVTWNPQFHCVRISSKIPRQSNDAWDRRAREPTCLRSGTFVYPKIYNVSCKSSHPWCSSSTAICQERLAKHNTIARHYWRPSTFRDTMMQQFHCDLRDWVAKHKRIARHCCRTHRFDAPVPMHKVSQRMQNTIAQQQQRREKVTWNHQFHCVRISSKIPRQSNDAWDRRAREPTYLRNETFPSYPNIQIASMM